MFDKELEELEKNHENNEALATIYLRACDAVAALEHIKDIALEHLERNMIARQETWGQCEFATFGITEPKAKAKIDETAWKNAVADSLELNMLELEYMKARMPFMLDATQDPRPYIRRRRGSNE